MKIAYRRSRVWRVAVLLLWALIALAITCLASVWVLALTIKQASVGQPVSSCSWAIQRLMVHQAMPSGAVHAFATGIDSFFSVDMRG
jgi:ABC-type antimicrobial peptide transport system permease subunit